MQYQELLQKRDAYQKGRDSIPESVLARFEREFEIQYIHESKCPGGKFPDTGGDQGGTRGRRKKEKILDFFVQNC